VAAFDPKATENYQKIYSHSQKITWLQNAAEVFEKTDGVFLVTPWPRDLELFYAAANLQRMRTPLVVDCRGKLDPKRMKDLSCRTLSPLTPDPLAPAAEDPTS
jgi:UDP-glucose 6-dehydrogenase